MGVKTSSNTGLPAGENTTTRMRPALLPGLMLCLAVTASAMAIQAWEERATGHPLYRGFSHRDPVRYRHPHRMGAG